MPLLATAMLAMTLMQGAEAAPPAKDAPYTTLSERLNSWFGILHLHKSVPKPHRHSDKIKHRSWGESGWIIDVKTDGFTGVVECRLFRRQMIHDQRVSYADGALGFRHNYDVDASKIWFRVDDQPARPWTSVYRDLLAKGLTVVPYRAGYKSDNTLLLPVDELVDASEVTLRLADKSKPEKFKISGFTQALEASKQVGCTEDNYIR